MVLSIFIFFFNHAVGVGIGGANPLAEIVWVVRGPKTIFLEFRAEEKLIFWAKFWILERILWKSRGASENLLKEFFFNIKSWATHCGSHSQWPWPLQSDSFVYWEHLGKLLF